MATVKVDEDDDGACMLVLAEAIPRTRDEQPDPRVQQTLAYACALLGENEARRMLHCIKSMDDHKGTLRVEYYRGFLHRWEKSLTEAWEAWGNEYEIEFVYVGYADTLVKK